MRHAVTARIGREGHAVRVRHWDARVSFAGSRLSRNLTAQNGERQRPRFQFAGSCATGSISDFAEPVELLSCAGSCTCTCSGSCTCAPLLTSFCAPCAPLITSLVPSCTPLLTPLHASGLSLSIGYCQYRRSRGKAERSRQTHQRKGLSVRDHFRFDDCTHVKP